MDRHLEETAVAAEPNSAGIDQVLALGQVYSVFQPIIDLDSGSVVGYEALARGPVGPLQRPDTLFAAAREAGRLSDLDALCRRVAIHGAIHAGIYGPLTLFVNVESEILDMTQLEELQSIAESAPRELMLMLEITERALAARPAELLATVRRLRSAGWRIALDDVGANDHSLAFMPLLRPDIIKLDLPLVQHRPGPKVAEIMNAVNAYAERTGSVVLAEGIENEQHLAAALALGARLGQGWMFGRPSPHTAPALVIGAIQLPPMTAVDPSPPLAVPAAGRSPFECLPDSVPLRCSTKPLLVEVSRHLEREAMRLGSTCIVVSTFQHARHFGPVTARRYRDLADRVAFVAAIGAGIPAEPVSGVRGADLESGDPVRGEWDIVVLAPHFAAALIARDLDPSGPDLQRTFSFALTYDRHTVEVAARSLMARILPHHIPVINHTAAAVEPPNAGGDQSDAATGAISADPVQVPLDRCGPATPRFDDPQHRDVGATDPLTGLLNRRRLRELLETSVLEARLAETGVALLHLTLDDLPAITRRFGHLAGDALLRICADRLRSRLRRGDLIAHLGGGQFVVILPGLDQTNAASEGHLVATELATALAAPIVTEYGQVAATVSTAVSAFPADDDHLDGLLHAAHIRRTSDAL